MSKTKIVLGGLAAGAVGFGIYWAYDLAKRAAAPGTIAKQAPVHHGANDTIEDLLQQLDRAGRLTVGYTTVISGIHPFGPAVDPIKAARLPTPPQIEVSIRVLTTPTTITQNSPGGCASFCGMRQAMVEVTYNKITYDQSQTKGPIPALDELKGLKLRQIPMMWRP